MRHDGAGTAGSRPGAAVRGPGAQPTDARPGPPPTPLREACRPCPPPPRLPDPNGTRSRRAPGASGPRGEASGSDPSPRPARWPDNSGRKTQGSGAGPQAARGTDLHLGRPSPETILARGDGPRGRRGGREGKGIRRPAEGQEEGKAQSRPNTAIAAAQPAPVRAREICCAVLAISPDEGHKGRGGEGRGGGRGRRVLARSPADFAARYFVRPHESR